MAKTKPVAARQIEALLPFVRTFEIMGFQCGECPQSEPDSPHGSIIPGFGANDPVARFVETLHDHGWIIPAFDWIAWQGDAARCRDLGLASYLIPKVDVQVAATWVSIPGDSLRADYIATNAWIAAGPQPMSRTAANGFGRR